MRKIKTFESFCNEGFPVVLNDPIYAGDVFKVRYRANSDLSKQRNDAIPEPVNDLLDGFQEGDIVRGKDVQTGKYVKGRIVSLKKNSDGDHTEVKIKHRGEIVSLSPTTVSFTEDGDKGNKSNLGEAPVDKEWMDMTRGDTFTPSTYE